MIYEVTTGRRPEMFDGETVVVRLRPLMAEYRLSTMDVHSERRDEFWDGHMRSFVFAFARQVYEIILAETFKAFKINDDPKQIEHLLAERAWRALDSERCESERLRQLNTKTEAKLRECRALVRELREVA